MSRGIVFRIIGTLFFLTVNYLTASSQEKPPSPVQIMFYNTENLFDTADDPLTDDSEFLPSGPRHWNNSRYQTKLHAISKTLIASGGWEPPAIVGFAETENKKVLLDLISNTSLSRSGYLVIHEDSYDLRGIDVALIYRPSVVKLISYHYLHLFNENGKPVSTRPILRAVFEICNDTIVTYFNHWPSRRGGVMAGEELRLRMADLLLNDVDSIAASHSGYKFIITGDFNATPSDNVMQNLARFNQNKSRLVNISTERGFGIGTYRYQGIWETIDQVIASESLVSKKGPSGLIIRSAKALQNDFLLKKDPVYPGNSPFSTWRGFNYTGGFSDHLPVIIDLECVTSLLF